MSKTNESSKGQQDHTERPVTLYNGKSKEELAQMVANENEFYKAVKTLLLHIFCENTCSHKERLQRDIGLVCGL